MFEKIYKKYRGRDALVLSGIKNFNLRDTLECGQAFRYELLTEDDGYIEYLTVVDNKIIRLGQDRDGNLILYGATEKELCELIAPYLSLCEDYDKIYEEIKGATDSEWLKSAADSARGIRILHQRPFEALISFIISQNNNIPRIRKIIKKISVEYGKNLATGLSVCPKTGLPITDEGCRECGVCYTFPTAEDIVARPEGLLPARVGFRYGYILDACERVLSGEVNLDEIEERGSYEFTLSELKKIKGVGDKVASCVALFAFHNLDAFPIDVWMRRAIDTYFGGELEPKSLGKYAGIAQQYIFHYIRNIENS